MRNDFNAPWVNANEITATVLLNGPKCLHVFELENASNGVMTPRCGNGVVEPGEECDDATVCCNRATCQLAAGAKCTPGLDPVCCTAACNVQPTYIGCIQPGTTDPGYCNNGYCIMNRLGAAYSNLVGCNSPQTNACKEYTRFNGGSCTATDASFGLSGFIMKNGAVCNAALDKICQNGLCVTPPAPLEATENSVREGIVLQNPFEGEILYIWTLAAIGWTGEVGTDLDTVSL
jgi:hypothetical protein